jgi:AcrR family transcriptional regulator
VARDTRHAILEATLQLLEEGDSEFTYEGLAGRAGVARQTLYSQFPDRTELLIAAVDHARDQLGADDLAAPVYEAITARDALDALLDFHIAYTPKILRPSRAIEAQRAKDPELSRRFEQRPHGRRQITRHVMNRLAAEGHLDESWSVDEATDFVSALTTAAFTSDLIEERRWTPTQLRARLGIVIQGSLLAASTKPTTNKGGTP